MSRKPSNYNQVLKALAELHRMFPSHTMGMHLATALDGYGDLWSVSDKEFTFALERYRAQLEMDIPHSNDDIDKIIKEGSNLDTILNDEDDDDDWL
jgi:hypothetical protein